MKLSLAHIGQAMQAVGDYENSHELMAIRVQTDSRLVQPGDLFVCIQGECFDGHNFAREAVHKGALAVVVERPLLDLTPEVPVLLVHNSVQALADLAAYWRSQFQGIVVAVTGTAGKTSVKELIASILAQKATVGKNYKNWNNKLGVALSILAMSGREDYWVLEAGVSEIGEMEELSAILTPDLAVMVNVGPAHLQGLHTVQGVAREKAQLLKTIPKGGVAIVSQDYPELIQAVPRREDIVLRTFSVYSDSGADCFLFQTKGQVKEDENLVIMAQGQDLELNLPTGRFWILENILAASCAARHLGCALHDIQAGINRLCLPEHRGDTIECGHVTILDDCYNANPLSMRQALKWAKQRADAKSLVLILGEMKELGAQAEFWHEELGGWSADLDPTTVFYSGDHEQAMRRGFERCGGTCLYPVESEKEFLSLWRSIGLQSGVVLIKGSRGCALERFVRILQRELKVS
jgi:UDP-N-acetylmuramoyl-tripeptide--D-alanyl-D-alanine ligase